jgi:adenylate cyclase
MLGVDTMSERALDGLALWLAERAGLSVTDLHGEFCEELVRCGVSIWRSSLGLELLHPEQSGIRSVWKRGVGVQETQAPRGVEDTPAYINSPVRIIDETERPFRQRLVGRPFDLPLLEELRQEGATDYAIYPLPFLDRARSAYLSFVSDTDAGFQDGELRSLELAAKLVSPYAERIALRRVAIDLLDLYVGHYAGERIFRGQVRRGAVDEIEAAILMCDLRGFTVFSNTHPREIVIETLNVWFDAVADAVGAHEGEILKFMGDGLLAVFPSGGEAVKACLRVLDAAGDARTEIARLNLERTASGAPTLDFVMGLHIGNVAYGNVGGRHRLDFTVLGPAVNYASRLQALAKELGEKVLVSHAVAACSAGRLVDLGDHSLRGIGDAEKVFALAAL